MRILKSTFISLAILFLFPPLTYAEKAKISTECPYPTPTDSKIWRDFGEHVKSEYSIAENQEYLPNISSQLRLIFLITGHAFGRLASAVQNQPERRRAFECVQLALENDTPLMIIAYDIKSDPNSFRLMMQAAMGMHDHEVFRLTGIKSTEPFYHLFGGKIETPPSSLGPVLAKKPAGKTTTTIIKKDPVAVGGGIAAKDPTKIEASEGRCSNWMTMAFNDSKGNNDGKATKAACASAEKKGDFITSYNPISKACFVCLLDDWTGPSSGTAGGGSTVGTGTVGEGKSHPCRDSSKKVVAKWVFFGKRGPGTTPRPERGGVICAWPGTLGYSTYTSSAFKYFTCKKGYVNCRLKKTLPIETIEQKEETTIYRHKLGRGHRKPYP